VQEKWCHNRQTFSLQARGPWVKVLLPWKSFHFERLCPLGQMICPSSLRNWSSHETMVPWGKWPQVLGKLGYSRQMCSSSPRIHGSLRQMDTFHPQYATFIGNFIKFPSHCSLGKLQLTILSGQLAWRICSEITSFSFIYL